MDDPVENKQTNISPPTADQRPTKVAARKIIPLLKSPLPPGLDLDNPHINEFTYEKEPNMNSWCSRICQTTGFWYNHWNPKTIAYELIVTLGDVVKKKMKTVDKNTKEKVYLYLVTYLNGGICFNDGVTITNPDKAKMFFEKLPTCKPATIVDPDDSDRVLAVIGHERDQNLKNNALAVLGITTDIIDENVIKRTDDQYDWFK